MQTPFVQDSWTHPGIKQLENGPAVNEETYTHLEQLPLVALDEVIAAWPGDKLRGLRALPALSPLDNQVVREGDVVKARAWVFVPNLLRALDRGRNPGTTFSIYTDLLCFTPLAYNYKFTKKIGGNASWKTQLRVQTETGTTCLLTKLLPKPAAASQVRICCCPCRCSLRCC